VQFSDFLLVFAQFLVFFAHIVCTNFSGSKLCQCYFVSFFNLCETSLKGHLRVPQDKKHRTRLELPAVLVGHSVGLNTKA
jgi:hypothetical protein